MLNIILIIIAAAAGSSNISDCIWIEAIQEDFKDGIYEHTLYASHRLGGAIEFVPRFDLNNDGYLDLFTADYYGDNNYIYWGNATGYSINRRTAYPGGSGGSCDAADLNCDGFVDFVISKYYSPSLSIYWGSPCGPSPNIQTNLALGDGSNETSLIADFNKDGFLDIAIGNYCWGKAAVIWGSASGYSITNRTELPVTNLTGYNLETADFNKDNWLDLLIVDRQGPSNLIYWGSESGFSASNFTAIPYLSSCPHGASVADLNSDGWLDLVFTGCSSIQKAYIYWGSPTGFQNHQVLNIGNYTLGGNSINDLNNDGYLDILIIRGEPQIKPLIYWGSMNGYSDDNRTEINTPVWGSGGLVADFNYDGNLDIYLNNFDYNIGSYLFWGPDFNTYQLLPCEGRDHHAMAREIGNTYNRNYFEDYQSSIFDAGFIADWWRFAWIACSPNGSEIKMFLRSGNTPSPDNTWTDWVGIANGARIPESINARYLQYMAKFIYTNPSYLPILYGTVATYQQAALAKVDAEPQSIGIGEPEDTELMKTSHYSLSKNGTIIRYALSKSGPVSLTIYDAFGRIVCKLLNDNQKTGIHSIHWDGSDKFGKKLPAGTYFYHLETPSGSETKKLVVMK